MSVPAQVRNQGISRNLPRRPTTSEAIESIYIRIWHSYRDLTHPWPRDAECGSSLISWFHPLSAIVFLILARLIGDQNRFKLLLIHLACIYKSCFGKKLRVSSQFEISFLTGSRTSKVFTVYKYFQVWCYIESRWLPKSARNTLPSHWSSWRWWMSTLLASSGLYLALSCLEKVQLWW